MKRAQQEYVGICSACHRHFLSLEIFDFRDGRVFTNDQSGPFGTRVNIDSLDRIAVGFSDESRGPSRGPKVDALAVQKFQRFVAAETLCPLNRDAITGQIRSEEHTSEL